MTETVATLKAVGKEELAVELCGQIAKSDEDRLRLVLKLVASVVGGGERVAPKPPGLASSQTTFEQFGRKWTSNDLAREYRRKVKVIDHHDNAARLEKFVYPLVYAPTLPPDDPTYVGWRIG